MGKIKTLSALAKEHAQLQSACGFRRRLSWLLGTVILVGFLILPYLAYTQNGLLLNLEQMLGASSVATQATTPESNGLAKSNSTLPLNAHPAHFQGAGTQTAQSGSAHGSTQGPTPGSPRARTAFLLDRIWNPGPVAASHQAWENDCQACHRGNFSRVEDQACTLCHGKMGLHVKGTEPVSGLDPVAQNGHTLASSDDARCASCHREHKGRDSLVAQNRHFVGSECAACHVNIKATAPDSLLKNVSDFSPKVSYDSHEPAHPPFRLNVALPQQANGQANGQAIKFQRLRMPEGHSNAQLGSITEANGLKFPHDVHLNPKGVASKRDKKVLECQACHTPADTPSGFEPITMGKHCQDCHSLAFEPALPGREVPHGAPEVVLDTLAEFYSYLKLNPQAQARVAQGRLSAPARVGPSLQSKPATYPAVGMNANAQAEFAATQLFEKNACAVCHTVSTVKSPSSERRPGQSLTQYRIAPITQAHPWMPMAQFSHKAHAFESCTSCHAAPKSKVSSDVLMPAIETCQTCHTGTEPAPSKVQSDCGLCHNYHLHKPLTSVQAHPVGTAPITAQTKPAAPSNPRKNP